MERDIKGPLAQVFSFPFRTYAEVSLGALVRNIAELRKQSGREVIAVIKANAYGHGLVPVAKAVVTKAQCQTLAVAILEEAVEVRQALHRHSRLEILVLSGFYVHQLDAYRKYHLLPVVHSLHQVIALAKTPKLPPLHLKVDTGMHRLGIAPKELGEVVSVLRKNHLKLAGVMTHFADADNRRSLFCDEQLRSFAEAVAYLRAEGVVATDALIHCANTAAILRGKMSPFCNAVRPGIGIYGVQPDGLSQSSLALSPVLDWKARVVCLKSVPAGETIGYGRQYKILQDTTLAVLPVGYGDGLPRLINQGYVLIQGHKVPLRGRVSMDLISVDCAGLPGVKEGSLAVLLGRSGAETLSADHWAHWSRTISYDVLCALAPRVPRLYLE